MKNNYIFKTVVLALLCCQFSAFSQTIIAVTSGSVNNTIQFSDNNQKLAESNLKVDIAEYYATTPSYARKVYMHFDISSIIGQTLTSGNLKINFSSSSSETAGNEGVTILANAYHGSGLPSSGVPKYTYDFSGFTKTALGTIFSVAADASITTNLGVKSLDIQSYLEARRDAGDTEVLIELEVTVDNSSASKSLFKVSSDTGAVAPSIEVDGPTLSSANLNSKLSDVYYNVSKHMIVNTQNVKGDYVIYNVLGQQVQEGVIESGVSVSSLNNGIYIYTTEKGNLKFVK